MQKAALQIAAYVGLAVLTVGGVIALTVSDRRNLAYLRDMQTAVGELDKAPPVPPNSDVSDNLPRLAALRHIVDAAGHNNESPPWSMRSGLYQAAPSIARPARPMLARRTRRWCRRSRARSSRGSVN
jgi:type VI protein secretion system component VasK